VRRVGGAKHCATHTGYHGVLAPNAPWRPAVVARAAGVGRWLRSGDFAANSIGVVFDPEDLLARYRAGEPIETLVARPPLPKGATPFDMLRF
jgi:hypothetical protein